MSDELAVVGDFTGMANATGSSTAESQWNMEVLTSFNLDGGPPGSLDTWMTDVRRRSAMGDTDAEWIEKSVIGKVAQTGPRGGFVMVDGNSR